MANVNAVSPFDISCISTCVISKSHFKWSFILYVYDGMIIVKVSVKAVNYEPSFEQMWFSNYLQDAKTTFSSGSFKRISTIHNVKSKKSCNLFVTITVGDCKNCHLHPETRLSAITLHSRSPRTFKFIAPYRRARRKKKKERFRIIASARDAPRAPLGPVMQRAGAATQLC